MGQVFALAKEFIEMPPSEIEKLLESPIHEVRAGGCSIMDKQARSKKTPEERRKELYDLYMRRHDRINNWDLVDVSAPYVVGGYLFDKPQGRRNPWGRCASRLAEQALPALEVGLGDHRLGHGSRWPSGGLPAQGAIVRGVGPQRPRATAGGLRGCWTGAEVGQFDPQTQEQKRQKQESRGSRGYGGTASSPPSEMSRGCLGSGSRQVGLELSIAERGKTGR